jgi:alkylhydroperoxidase/carboxymuconolactone decarboxylase family protein YurZ
MTTMLAFAGMLPPATDRTRGSPMSAESSDTPLLDLLGRMTVDSMETSSLDEQTLMLVRVAALVAVDAPPASYLLNLGAAGEVGVSSDQITGVLAGIAPIVGTTRVVAAAGKMVKALGAAVQLADLAQYGEEG